MVESKKFGPGFELKATIKPSTVQQNNPLLPEKISNQRVSSNMKYIGPQYVQAPQYNIQQQAVNQFVVQSPQQPQQQYPPNVAPQMKSSEYKVNQPIISQQSIYSNPNQYVIQGNSQNIGFNPYTSKK
jgi:hypothetical protein